MMRSHPILVVEDDEDIRESLMDFLQEHGYEAIGAIHGQEALDKLGEPSQRPCVIILDIMMPVMDGLAFREAQLRNPLLSTIPVIVISAYHDVEETARTLKADTHMAKPLNLRSLLAAVQGYCPSPAM
jgi:DNA-binding response OmpR family regulator